MEDTSGSRVRFHYCNGALNHTYWSWIRYNCTVVMFVTISLSKPDKVPISQAPISTSWRYSTSVDFKNWPLFKSPVHLVFETRMSVVPEWVCVSFMCLDKWGVLAAVSQLVRNRLLQSTVEALLCSWVTLTMSRSQWTVKPGHVCTAARSMLTQISWTSKVSVPSMFIIPDAQCSLLSVPFHTPSSSLTVTHGLQGFWHHTSTEWHHSADLNLLCVFVKAF